MQLWIIRHGHCGDTSPDSDLTPQGRQQAHRTAQRLTHADITTLLSSPLVRALETASIIAETLDTTVEVWPDLREGFSGQHQAYSREILLQRFPRANLPTDFADQSTDRERSPPCGLIKIESDIRSMIRHHLLQELLRWVARRSSSGFTCAARAVEHRR